LAKLFDITIMDVTWLWRFVPYGVVDLGCIWMNEYMRASTSVASLVVCCELSFRVWLFHWFGVDFNVCGGEQGWCHSVHAGVPVVLGDMACSDDSSGETRSSSSAHLPWLHTHQSHGCCYHCFHLWRGWQHCPQLLVSTPPGTFLLSTQTFSISA